MNLFTIINAIKAWVVKFFAKKADLDRVNDALSETTKIANASTKAVSNIKIGMRQVSERLMDLNDHISSVNSMAYNKMDSYNPRGTGSLSMNTSRSNPAGYNAVAVGGLCSATGSYSFAEGSATLAIGAASHAEGNGTDAVGNYSHTEGWHSTAKGVASHAEGCDTYAYSDGAHAQGVNNVRPMSLYPNILDFNWHNNYIQGTVVRYKNELYISYEQIYGDYQNTRYPDENASGWARLYTDDGTYAFIIGNGGSGSGSGSISPVGKKAPSNAHTIDWHGNAWFAGDVYVKSTSGAIKDEGSEKLLTETDVLQILRDKGLIE